MIRGRTPWMKEETDDVTSMRWHALTTDECHRTVSIMYAVCWPHWWPKTSAFNKIWKRVGKKLLRKHNNLRRLGLYEGLEL